MFSFFYSWSEVQGKSVSQFYRYIDMPTLLSLIYIIYYLYILLSHMLSGNSWGKDFITGKGCLGCGPQEQFYGCADVAIVDSNGQTPAPGTSSKVTATPRRTNRTTCTIITARPTQTPTTTAKHPAPPGPQPGGWWCEGVGVWKAFPNMPQWCVNNCRRGHCPPSHCRCS